MSATPEGCVHPSGRPELPEDPCSHWWQSHVNQGIVLRICMLCGEPDWFDVPREIRRIVREELLRIAMGIMGDPRPPSRELTPAEEVTDFSVEIDRLLAAMREGLLREPPIPGTSWVKQVETALGNMRMALHTLDRPPVAAVAEEGGPGEGGQGEAR